MQVSVISWDKYDASINVEVFATAAQAKIRYDQLTDYQDPKSMGEFSVLSFEVDIDVVQG